MCLWNELVPTPSSGVTLAHVRRNLSHRSGLGFLPGDPVLRVAPQCPVIFPAVSPGRQECWRGDVSWKACMVTLQAACTPSRSSRSSMEVPVGIL